MKVIRGLAVILVIGFLFFAGGPAVIVMVASAPAVVPVTLVVAVLLLAFWKIRELIKR